VTQKPPAPLPDPGLVLSDGTVIAGAEAVEAWHRAYLEHRRRLDAENRRYKAECAALRERYGPPAGAATVRPAGGSAHYQADFDGLDDTDDQAMFSSPSGEWFSADAAAYLPPCERSS
jgi:hypothetical protein